jgi:hypothetical protein
MATAFQKGNRHPTAGTEKAFIYVPNGVTAITNINSTSPTTIQQVVPWQFKGNGQVEISSPVGFNLPNGVTFGAATLVANASGSYAAGFHPIVQYSVLASSGNVNVANTDVFIVQY